MSKFQDLWKSTAGHMGKAVQIVCEYDGGSGPVKRIFESEHEYAEWIMEMGSSIKIISMRKSGHGGLVQKPGNSVHTAKWDRCVEHVRSSSPGADPYAVCTAMLGDESFKAMDDAQFDAVVDKALEELGKDMFGVGQFGIAGAGPIPESKLARQDLEGSSTQKHSLVSRIAANQKVSARKGGTFADAWSRVKPR